MTNTSKQHAEVFTYRKTMRDEVRAVVHRVPHLGGQISVEVPDDQVPSVQAQCKVLGISFREGT